MKIVIANWKMNFGLEDSLIFVKNFKRQKFVKTGEIVLAPSFIALSVVQKALAGTKIKLGAQDVFWEEKGAFTGEISPLMLKEIGVLYVIIGHSERRQYLKETDEMIAKKVRAALENRLIPVLCIGETLKERKQRLTERVIKNQLNRDLAEVKSQLLRTNNLVIAYEPIWAIGTGRAASPKEIVKIHQLIRNWFLDNYEKEIAQKVKIIYGGSVNKDNIRLFASQPMIEGFLVGGASLDLNEFIQIIKCNQ
jgi:triosephosphate isomerase